MRIWHLLLVALCVSSPLSGGIEEYFKAATEKQDCASIPGVDFIYVINLDQRPEKLAYCLGQLEPFGIVPYRFSAVNGWELPMEVVNRLGVEFDPGMREGLWGTYYPLDGGGIPYTEEMHVVGRNYFCYQCPLGSIGIVLSHLSVLQDAYDSDYETIWVMEDDIEVIRDPREVSELILRLDEIVGREGWDILFTDRDTKGRDGKYVICRSYMPRPNFTPSNPNKFAQTPRKVSADFKRIFARYGTYSMIIRKSGMKKLLDFFKTYKIFLPYDMDFYLPETIRLFTVTQDVVSTIPDAYSDNSKPGYAE